MVEIFVGYSVPWQPWIGFWEKFESGVYISEILVGFVVVDVGVEFVGGFF